MKPSGPKLLLHAEGLLVLVAACITYQALGASWLIFALLFLAPDLAIAGYALGTPMGARIYNAAHTYVGPALLWAVAQAAEQPPLVTGSVIWVAHIGFDRLLGFGLKYPTRFRDTHLHRL